VADLGLTEFDLVDIPCTNAGILRDKLLWNMSDEDFDDLIRTRLRGTFTCARRGAADAHALFQLDAGDI
jgi:NAD(P)-dependent dehydrogenase (short-subunit alcohol dehydrogenase family)